MDKVAHDAGLLVEDTLTAVYGYLRAIPGSSVVVRYVRESHQDDPARSVLELLLLLFAIRYFFASKYSYNKQNYVKLTENEVDELVDEWEPEPLVPELTEAEQARVDALPVVARHNGPRVQLANDGDDSEYVNFTTTDVYNLNNDANLADDAVRTIRQYGVGSCGPAGFYGHQDAHGNAENDIAQFLGTEACILYSQGLATASSVIPCFLKRGHIVVADKKVNLALQKGIELSRATVFWYEHNDVADLERALARANAKFRRGPLPRKFIVTEGLFENVGDKAPLRAIVDLKHRYKYRLLLDESWSLGVLGATGRGLCEDAGVPRSEIDITIGSLASAWSSSGGFCAGETVMVEHQRITSLAYTFSATMPAYLAKTTSNVSRLFADSAWRDKRIASLRSKVRAARDVLAECPDVDVVSDPASPHVIFELKAARVNGTVPLDDDERQRVQDTLLAVCDAARARKVLVAPVLRLQEHEILPVDHALRIIVNDGLSEADVVAGTRAVVAAIADVVKRG